VGSGEGSIEGVTERVKVNRAKAPRFGAREGRAEAEVTYSAERVHLMPESPHLWASGAVQREQFAIFAADLLSQQNWTGVAQLWAQLVFQTHKAAHMDVREQLGELLVDQLPVEPLPALSEFELFGVFFALHKIGLNHHAIALWRHHDTAASHGRPILKPHTHYYSQALGTGPYTLHADVRSLQLLICVLEAAHAVNDHSLVAEVFERLTGGLLEDVERQKAPKSDIPATPLWHSSYLRQLRCLEIALSHLDLHTQPELAISYINTFRLKFATCWTPRFLLRIYDVLNACKTQEPALTFFSDILDKSIKQLSYKIATHETLQAIRNEPVLNRVRSSFPELKLPSADVSSTSDAIATQEPHSVQTHPGTINLIARAIELTADPSKALQNYQVVKQIYLECFEAPYYFQDLTSIAEPALKHFILGNDAVAVTWLYQRMIEQDIGISVNARNLLMHWALRQNKDAVQCIEFFNDLLVALGPQSANGATILVLLEAIQSKGDLAAALNALAYIRENIKSWTILKQALETTFQIALEQKDVKCLQSIVDEMCVQLPKTYNKRWRPTLVEFLTTNSITWTPPIPLETGNDVGLFL
jgi:hypothetical protein